MVFNRTVENFHMPFIQFCTRRKRLAGKLPWPRESSNEARALASRLFFIAARDARQIVTLPLPS